MVFRKDVANPGVQKILHWTRARDSGFYLPPWGGVQEVGHRQ